MKLTCYLLILSKYAEKSIELLILLLENAICHFPKTAFYIYIKNAKYLYIEYL